MAKNILIVDDEPTLVKGLRFNLEQQEGYVIDVAYDLSLIHISSCCAAP